MLRHRGPSACREPSTGQLRGRICLRVRDRSDSIALVSTATAAELPAEPKGRAIASVGGAAATLVQVATVDAQTIARIVQRWASAPRPARPWRDPLPATVTIDSLPSLLDGGEPVVDAGVIGVIDRPDRQRIEPWTWSARQHGLLLAVGAAGCGRSGLAAAIAATGPSIHVPQDAAIAWDRLERLAGSDGDHGGVALIIDDLDLVVDRFEPEHRQVWLDRLVGLCRRRRELGIGIVVTAASVDGPMRLLEPHASTRVLMRLPSRQDHRLAGGDGDTWDARMPPGGAVVDGRRAQVLDVPGMGGTADVEPEARARRLGTGRVVVIAADPAAAADRLAVAGRPVLAVAEALASTGALPPDAAIVGDAAAWQSRWDALDALGAGADVLVTGLPIATMRAVTGRRELPPPLPPGDEWCWMLGPGRIVRARLP